MGHKLAIDFGTTNSVIARWNESSASAEIIAPDGISAFASSDDQIVVPSLLYLEEGDTGRVTIGQLVRERGLDRENSIRLFRNFKRGVVDAASSAAREIDGATWTDRDAARIFVRELIDRLPYPGDEIEQLVLTVPVVSFEHYLTWLNETAGVHLHDRLRIVDESTAAALGYAVTQPGAIVMVLDFGGGSLDVSLVQLPEHREQTGGFLRRLRRGDTKTPHARVIAKAGRIIGGSDVDQWMLDDVLTRVEVSQAQIENDRASLLSMCEQTKIALSTQDSARMSFEVDGRVYDVMLTRAELECLLDANGFFAALQQVVDKTLHVAQREGVFKEDIHMVLTVGGTALMPAVQAVLRNYFDETIVRVDKPFTAVAEGALQVAAGLGLEDYLVHGYGVRYLHAQTGAHAYEEIIPIGSRYPLTKPIEMVFAAAHEQQEAVEFVIGEIDAEAVSTIEVKYEDGQAVFLAQADQSDYRIVPLNEEAAARSAAQLTPRGVPGIDRLRVQFSVDDQRQLIMSVFDLQTKRDVLSNAIAGRLDARETETITQSEINGREPQLSTHYTRRGQWRLSLRALATTLSVVSPESISLEAAEAALRSDDFFVRYRASLLLMRRADRDARLVLQAVLDNGEAPARASVARQLHGFSWFAVEPLLRQSIADSDTRVRAAAVYALCDMRDVNAFRLMADVLPHEPDGVRAAAAWGLRNCQDVAALPVLEAVVAANDPDVRIRGLEALGANGQPAAMPILWRMLNDPIPDVQYAAVLSLLECGRESCLSELSQMLAQTSGVERIPILRGLFHATNYLFIDLTQSGSIDLVLDALERCIVDAVPEVRMAAAWPLAWMRHERASAILKHAHSIETDLQVKQHLFDVAVNLMSDAARELRQTHPPERPDNDSSHLLHSTK